MPVLSHKQILYSLQTCLPGCSYFISTIIMNKGMYQTGNLIYFIKENLCNYKQPDCLKMMNKYSISQYIC
jgi:hypothetical protein